MDHYAALPDKTNANSQLKKTVQLTLNRLFLLLLLIALAEMGNRD